MSSEKAKIPETEIQTGDEEKVVTSSEPSSEIKISDEKSNLQEINTLLPTMKAPKRDFK